MTVIVPGFAYRQIPTNYSVEHWDWSLGLVLHVATGGNNSLHGWFSNPAAQASSHWWAGYNEGEAEQYLDPEEHISWAQAAGNDSYHSVETAGNPEDPLTEAQCRAVARIYRWGHDRFGWPYRLAERPGEQGLGWHGMGGAAWGGHTGCPGELRRAQRQHILDLAQGGAADEREEDMQLTDTVRRPDGHESTVGDILAWLDQRLERLDRITRPDGKTVDLATIAAYNDQRLERLEHIIAGGGIDVLNTDGTSAGRQTDLATEAAWNSANVLRLLAASGVSDEQIAQIRQAIVDAKIQISVVGPTPVVEGGDAA